MRAAFVLVLLAVTAAATAEEPTAPPVKPAGDRSEKAWAVAPSEPFDRTPKRVAAPTRIMKKTAGTDELRLLGDVRALDVREGEALLRVNGVEQTIRPGMRLMTDVVKSISPQRLVLVRPEGVDERRGETLIVVDFLGAGRSRVRMYATRDWTAQPPRLAE